MKTRHAAATAQGSLLERPFPKEGKAAGIDEAGRGCLAGPVVAAAVILPDNCDLPGLTDSKRLSANRREKLAPQIKAKAVAWGLGIVWPRRIDKINILQATFEAMARAVCILATPPALLRIDGNQILPAAVIAPLWQRHSTAALPRQEAIVGGDASVNAISAASILAKTFRDGLMEKLARRWPDYGFEHHKGYGTQEHLRALRILGPCPMHRLSFKGVLPPAASCAQGLLC